MKKKEKKLLKQLLKEQLTEKPKMATHVPPNSLVPPVGFDDLDFQIIADQDTYEIYVKITGFYHQNDSIKYAEYLAKYLPLLLYKSEVIH